MARAGGVGAREGRTMTRRIGFAVLLLAAFGQAAAAEKVVIVQTNAAGDNIHLIDTATNKIVGEIKGIEVTHGAAAAPDGSRFYFSNESNSTLEVVDGRTLAITKSIPLSGKPNNISIGKDWRHDYVAIPSDPRAAD